ncbi:hypothetical protein ATEIFO6365_0012042100 [Aspergillus terreus]|uniref:Uncharacterized protein n=1 Tax=Aspergillus terreus TaxID=33178 RepID=A0A5M3ZCY1_ASPTE|nr:hypothetical protein ATETN484_0013043200 [Aspergillus terreus]GFF20664.1 hypothetical protein ATEIFO6365_0012042100 [Aspergillus terreus]
MARALDTLDITHEPIRQIFYSTIAGTPYKRALNRLQPRTETRSQLPSASRRGRGPLAEADQSSRGGSDNKENEAEEDLPPPIIESTLYAPSTDGRRQPVLPSLPSAGQRWLDEILFGFCVSCLTTTSIQQGGDKFAANLVAFTAVLGIQASTLTLKKPYSYSTSLSALIWVSWVLLLEYALPLRRYRYLPDVRPRHKPTYALLLAAQASPLPGIALLRRRDRWDRRAEPELLPLRWRNTAAAPRNLYLREGTVLFITEYSRFLPPAVSRLVVLYLLRVRPFLKLLHQQLRPDGQPRLSPSRGQDITTHYYRHIAIAVAKKHLASQATPADWGTAAAAIGNILAAQAGHHGRINEQVYAVEARQPFGLLPGRIEQFAVASRLWHSLLLRPTLPEGRSGCESESLLPDLSRSSQPTQKPYIRSDPRPHAVRSLP